MGSSSRLPASHCFRLGHQEQPREVAGMRERMKVGQRVGQCHRGWWARLVKDGVWDHACRMRETGVSIEIRDESTLEGAGAVGAPAGVMAAARAAARERVYDGSFLAAYLSNTSLLIAASLLFRYSDFVTALGGDESDLGWITGIGTTGAIVMRLLQGDAIDRFGARAVWRWAMLCYAASIPLHLWITDVSGIEVYLVNLAMAGSISGTFGASITFVSLRAPAHRTTEVIGTLGSSGFLGMAIGPLLGDWIYAGGGPLGQELMGAQRQEAVDRLFLAATAFAVLSWATAFWATRGAQIRPQTTRRRPPSWWLVRRYQPGFLLVVAIAMGLGIGTLQIFVRPFAEHLGVASLKTFFLTYASTAFLFRMLTRTWPARYGEPRMIVLGMATLGIAMGCFPWVHTESMLVLPAVVAGAAHAFLFPAVVASGCAAFPSCYRGLATTLVLAMFDVGNLIGRPSAGQIVTRVSALGGDGYQVMFITIAIFLLVVALVFALRGPRGRRARRMRRRPKLAI